MVNNAPGFAKDHQTRCSFGELHLFRLLNKAIAYRKSVIAQSHTVIITARRGMPVMIIWTTFFHLTTEDFRVSCQKLKVLFFFSWTVLVAGYVFL